MNRLGIEMLTLLGMPPVEHVKLAGELGCVAISTGLTGLPLDQFGVDLTLYPLWSLADDPALRREMKAAMQDTGVHIGLGEGFRVRDDADVREWAPQLDIMAELGASRINTISMDAGKGRTFDQMAIMAEMALDRGMAFTMEFIPGCTLGTLQDTVAVVEHIGRGRAGALIDAMHFFRSGGTVAEIEALDPELIGYVQLCDVPMISKDNYMGEAMFARMTPGEGELPLKAFVAALPEDVEIGLEVPNIATFQAGVTPAEHAARVVRGARAVGA